MLNYTYDFPNEKWTALAKLNMQNIVVMCHNGIAFCCLKAQIVSHFYITKPTSR